MELSNYQAFMECMRKWENRLMMSHDRLYALALYEWTEQHFAQNDDTSNAAAGENGCDFPTHNNST